MSEKHSASCLGYICSCDELIKALRAENARYREALFKIMVTINDPKSILYQLSCEALGLGEPEPDEVYDYDGP